MRKEFKLIMALGIVCVSTSLTVAHILYVYFTPTPIHISTTPVAFLKVEKVDSNYWKLTIDNISEEIMEPEKRVTYRILNEREEVIMTGALKNNSNITLLDMDNSSTLSKGDVIYVPLLNQNETIFQLIYIPTGAIISEIVLK